LSNLVATITRANGQKYELSIRELAALKFLLETDGAKKLRADLFRIFAETAGVDEKEAQAIIGPMLLEAYIDQARELAKE
jgi:hypothetical protein